MRIALKGRLEGKKSAAGRPRMMLWIGCLKKQSKWNYKNVNEMALDKDAW